MELEKSKEIEQVTYLSIYKAVLKEKYTLFWLALQEFGLIGFK